MKKCTFRFKFYERPGQSNWPKVKDAIERNFSSDPNAEKKYEVKEEPTFSQGVISFLLEMEPGDYALFTCSYYNFLHGEGLDYSRR